MSIWDFRQAIESRIPLWVYVVVMFIGYFVVHLVGDDKRK